MSNMPQEHRGTMNPPVADAPPLFRKTKMCTFNMQGRCLRGSACAFAHNQDELKAKPDFSKTSMCENLLTLGQCDDAACKFAHSRQELRRRVPAQAVIAPVAAQSSPTSRSNVIETKREASATKHAGKSTHRTSIEAIHAVIAAPVLCTPHFLERDLPDSIRRPQAMAPYDEHNDMGRSPVNHNEQNKRRGHEALSRQTKSGICNEMHLGKQTPGNFTSDSDVDNQNPLQVDSQTKIDGTSPVDSPSLLVRALDLCTGPSTKVHSDSFYVFGDGEMVREKKFILALRLVADLSRRPLVT
eukprot:gnl/TRDRNA2_/TRDRNA2_177536_c0_seq23.p1 gnl/TRDRNA2_/TRDRNA2_177536_c0~~gnl/TRDRNA2_/TRDRNA2_177536_c0_seq23.p1  ORF type:complete len:299 (-),score=54.07 gnl/TRDRNA2_/TRDRNA2_177536_c0_seq23:48-944(-)